MQSFIEKQNIFKLGTKSVFFGCFGQQFRKTILTFEINTIEFALLQCFLQNLKFLNLGPKVSLFWGWNLKILLSYLKSTSSNLSHCIVCCKNKIYRFGTKNAWLGYFGTGSWKLYCHIWNQHPQICLIAKFCEIIKILKFGSKNALFGYFWAGMWIWYCHIWNQHPRNCPIAKFHEKTKMSKFWTKNTIFRVEF